MNKAFILILLSACATKKEQPVRVEPIKKSVRFGTTPFNKRGGLVVLGHKTERTKGASKK